MKVKNSSKQFEITAQLNRARYALESGDTERLEIGLSRLSALAVYMDRGDMQEYEYLQSRSEGQSRKVHQVEDWDSRDYGQSFE